MSEPASLEIRGPERILWGIGLLALADVISQYAAVLYPWNTGAAGWRLTAVQVAVTQLLPIGIALCILAVAARLRGNPALRAVRNASLALALGCLLATWYLLTSGSQFVLGAPPRIYGTVRIGLLQALTGAVMGFLAFGITGLLLWRLLPAPREPA